MEVLSLFDGIACGYEALKRANINFDKYYASEIDKYAISVAQKNHPDIIQLGDINNWKNWDIDFSHINLIIGGSPCQGFTWAGKKLNFDDERSKLFFVFADILKHTQKLNPNVKFLLENVKMQSKHKDVISNILGVEPILINSNSFSAQNRQRYYWFNWQISDKKLLPNEVVIKHIIRNDDNANEKIYVSKRHHQAWLKSYPQWKPCDINNKAKPLLATYYKQPPHCPYIQFRKEFEDEEKEKEYKYSLYRRLSPIECERLQTIDDNYTQTNSKGEEISFTQRWKMIGNAWTVNVITYIFNQLK